VTDPVGSAPDARHLEVLATAEHRAALRAAGLRTWWRRRLTWLRPVASTLLLLVGLALYDVPVPVVLLVAVGLPALSLGLARLRLGRGMDSRLAQSWADGTLHGTVFDEAGFASRGPLGAVEYRLPAIRTIRRREGVVEVWLRPHGVALLPAELFPVEEEERLARAVRTSGA
jgi:hypothetical protein